jgi:Ca2+-binding EF-hand superfamily protein
MAMSGSMILMLKKSSDRRQQDALEKAFQKADVNGDGYLSPDEYYRILKEHGIQCSREEILQIIKIADKDHDGVISREEFLGEPAQKSSSRRGSTADKADVAFNAFDKNRDGYITKGEMLKTSKNLTKKQVQAVFELNDTDHDGKLTREEFHEFMNHPQGDNAKRDKQ